MSNGDQARKYVLLDASALAGYFIPTAAETVKACERVTVLVEAVRKRAVDQVLLYLPNVCIPEVFGFSSPFRG